MRQRRTSSPDATTAPAPLFDHEQPIYRQLYLRLRDAILSGTMLPGQRLASSRALASQFGIARNTVLQAYVQLEVEGYLQVRSGSGHFVSQLRPPTPAGAAWAGARRPAMPPAEPAVVQNSFDFVPESLRHSIPAVPFRVNQPDLNLFPIETWVRLQSRTLRDARDAAQIGSLLGEGDAQGDLSLRRAIAEHVSIARGLHCSADTVLITAGAQHAMDMLLRVLTRPGDAVGLEDPCFPGAYSAARAANCQIVPMPVDAQGAGLPDRLASAATPCALLLCPSKQFPLGITMSLPRRLALIDWAMRNGAWIIEDDYDSEYRFDGKPIPSMQSLDGSRNVVYVGTFSKVLFPSLRIGFIVCPQPLIEPLTAARAISGRHGSTLEQRVLARFINEGHLARHVRRMRAVYRERQEVLLEVCARKLRRRLVVERAQSGLQTMAWLQPGVDDQRLVAQARDVGIALAALSRFCLQTPREPALVMGFGGFDEDRIRDAVGKLARLDF